QVLRFKHAIIATGSLPSRVLGLDVESERIMDSTSALEVPEIPERFLVIGGGYIGLELGQVYAALGSRVTVVEMTDGLLPGADRDLVDILAKRVSQTMKAVMLKTKVVQMKLEKGGIRVTFEGEAQNAQVFDRVLVSVGRRPNIGVPGLDRTRVQITDRGFIRVDEQMRT